MATLVVAAHPDDEVLGCGGTIARSAQAGEAVYIAILGEGITSRYQTREQANPALVETLQQRSRQVAELLGAREVFTFGFPDNRLDTVPLLDVVKVVEDLLTRVRPDVLYTHHGGDLNVDHSIVFRATLIATRPIGGTAVKSVFAYEVPSSTEWAFQRVGPAFTPNVFVDIARSLEIKTKAMEAYDSEARAFPHPRSAEALRARAQYWGSVAGVGAAEAFELIRDVR